ncbi:MACPF domain-containing protein At1g14780 isoform X2 [Vigna angularis]|uniref:MACPF domain-containing protein At1g14780 isoform X2 n=1 Tax=Phaseolus angularis TaxID=3914 RepID=UPI00080A1C01|nr:MACPF domain-containing protein At1g14780 isoform X2 [Vigna angularis]
MNVWFFSTKQRNESSRCRVSDPSGMSPVTSNATRAIAPATNPTSSPSIKCQSSSTRRVRSLGESHLGTSTPCLGLMKVRGQLMLLTPSVWVLMVILSNSSVFILIGTHLFCLIKSLKLFLLPGIPLHLQGEKLVRFIEKFGTHILVGLSIGGKDLVLVKQDVSSSLEPSELKRHLDELGNQLFTGTCSFLPRSKDQKYKVPQAFDVFGPQIVAFSSSTSVCAKDGISVICAKRGGDTQVSDHSEWLHTVPKKPDAVDFSFIPITSLLKGLPGKGFLSHAINLYLRYKPPMSDLPYFLDYQAHKLWAPVHNDLPLCTATNRTTSSPSLSFNLIGPKLYVNTSKVTVGKRPITGMRLFLEGMKCNRLAIHVQHLLNTPIMLKDKIQDTPIWSEEISDDGFFEAINGKKFSHVCTAPVKYDPRWSSDKDVAFIVTGAQLHVKKHESRSVLHLRLLFSQVSNCVVVKSSWTQGSSGLSQRSGIFSLISTSISGKDEKKPVVVLDSSVFPTGPPVPVQTQKLLKFVDTSQLCKGPQDSPGHWLVTGARLVLDKGKICLWAKFSLLNIGS